MLLELILDVFRGLFNFVFGLLPSIDVIALPQGFMTWFTGILATSAYFLPLADMLIMFGIWIVVTNFQIIWKGIQRIWDALPFT